MAKLSSRSDTSDEELPEVSVLLQGSTSNPIYVARGFGTRALLPSPNKVRQSGRRCEFEPRSQCIRASAQSDQVCRDRSVTSARVTYSEAQNVQRHQRSQRPLKLAYVNSLLLPKSQRIENGPRDSGRSSHGQEESTVGNGVLRSSPRKQAKRTVQYESYGYWSDIEEDATFGKEEESEGSTDLDGFLVDDDEELSGGETSETEERCTSKTPPRNPKETLGRQQEAALGPFGILGLEEKLKDGDLASQAKPAFQLPTHLAPSTELLPSPATNYPDAGSPTTEWPEDIDKEAILRL